jgi:prepilin-type N-terminal cleavage/methylation domain-containing protein
MKGTIPMNTFKKNGGFTLVELIIVIAILAILSSVAVAGYSTYITKANQSVVNTYKADVQRQAMLANAETGETPKVDFDYADGKLTVKIDANTFAETFPTDFQGVFALTDAHAVMVKDAEDKDTDVVDYYEFEETDPKVLAAFKAVE